MLIARIVVEICPLQFNQHYSWYYWCNSIQMCWRNANAL